MNIWSRSIRSNFDLNTVPGPDFDVDSASRKGFFIYRLYWGWNWGWRFHFGIKKSDKLKKIKDFIFCSFGGLNLIFPITFFIYYHFKMTRRAGWSIPTRRVLRMQVKLQNWGLPLIGTIKYENWKFEDALYVQFLIWIHFRKSFCT